MTKEEFVSLHPTFSWWVVVLLLVFLFTACFALWRIKHPPGDHAEIHSNQGVMLGALLGGSIVTFVIWVCWLLWRASFYMWLHLVLPAAS